MRNYEFTLCDLTSCVLDVYLIALSQVVVEECCHGELEKIYHIICKLKEWK